MTKKPPITNVTSGFSSTTALNNNFTSLRDGFDNTLSLDGSTPNAMQAELDLANNNIINVGSVETDTLLLNGVLLSPSGVDPVFSGTVSTFGASLIADADATEGRATLGLGTAATASSTDYVSVSGDSITGNLSFGDNNKVIFGAGSDMELFHDGSNSHIRDNGTGNLYLRGGGTIELISPAEEKMIVAAGNSSVSLYHDNSKKLETTATGIAVTGTVNATSYTGDGSNLTGIPAPALEIIAYARVSNATTNPLTVDFSTGFSSMARTGTGNYTFTFSSARSSVDYMVFCQCASGSTSRTQAVNTQSTTAFNVDTRIISSGGTIDEDFNVIVYALPS